MGQPAGGTTDTALYGALGAPTLPRTAAVEVNAARTVNQLISAVSMAMDIEDGVKLYHGWRVAIVAANLSRSLGLKEQAACFYGGLLHDVGGVSLPLHVVHYLPRLLDEQQRTAVLMTPAVISHPLLSAEIVSSLPGMSGAARFVLDHHECWNGHGFPRGLHDTEIGMGAQVLRSADATDLILRASPTQSLDEVCRRVALLASAEIAPDVAECLIEELRAGLYDGLVDTACLPEWFEDTRRRVGSIPVERGTDAVGATLEVLSRVVDNKHPYTIGHSRRVARYALLVAIGLGLEHDDITALKWAALIHDVGKLSIPAHMLDKPTALSAEEYQAMQFHVSYTFDIVSAITDLRSVAAIAASHHEHFDGSGYPFGRAGEDIPLGGRILAVADAFDAMTSHRPYRLVNDVAFACAELERGAGTQFDPQVAKTAVPVLRNLGLVIAGA